MEAKHTPRTFKLTTSEIEACHLLYPVLRLLADLHEENADVAEALDGEVAVAYRMTRATLLMQAARLQPILPPTMRR